MRKAVVTVVTDKLEGKHPTKLLSMEAVEPCAHELVNDLSRQSSCDRCETSVVKAVVTVVTDKLEGKQPTKLPFNGSG
jgi:hypothetical protein